MMTYSVRNPRSTTASPFLRGLEKNATVISWLWRWHYSTNQVTAELLASRPSTTWAGRWRCGPT